MNYLKKMGRGDVSAVQNMDETQMEVQKPEGKAEPKPEIDAETKIEAKAEPKPDAKAKTKPDAKSGHQHVVKVKPKPGSPKK